jgi:exosortase family protein XrtF
MISLKAIYSELGKVPKPILNVGIKALLLFLLWKAVYLLFLLPARQVDKPLTDAVGNQTVRFLNLVHDTQGFVEKPIVSETIFEGQSTKREMSVIFFNGKRVMGIADGCNGLELIVLYIGFILIMPAKIKRKILFIIFGVLLIYMLNVLRCAGLATIQIYVKHFFVFAHHYLFKIIIYSAIFILWVFFSRNLTFQKDA